MNWLREFNAWLGVVTEHYGSLEKFQDARTIRIMIEGGSREEAELKHVLNSLDAVGLRDETYEEFLAEFLQVTRAISDLKLWLDNRNLEP